MDYDALKTDKLYKGFSMGCDVEKQKCCICGKGGCEHINPPKVKDIKKYDNFIISAVDEPTDPYSKFKEDLKHPILYMPYIPLQISSAFPKTLADIPFKDIKVGMKLYFNGTVKFMVNPKTFVNEKCVITRKEDYGRITLLLDDGLNISTDAFSELSFDPIVQNNPHGDTFDMLFKQEGGDIESTEALKPKDNKWNTTCPICGGSAYQGLGKIECENEC